MSAPAPFRALPGEPVTEQVERLLAEAAAAPGGDPGPLGIVQLGIVQLGDPVLRATATPYEGQLPEPLLARLITVMRTTMLAAPGVGLAAPQIGLSLAIAVVADEWELDAETAAARERTAVPFRVLVNPSYTPLGDERVTHPEGCLSVRGHQGERARWRRVRLTGADHTGATLDEELTGWPARIVQHETDHLRGELYLDVLPPDAVTES